MVYWVMKYETFEPVEVIAHFDRTKVNILKFKRKNTVYRVTTSVNKWRLKEGDNPVTHFIVECKDQKVICELALYHNNYKWELIQYDHLE